MTISTRQWVAIVIGVAGVVLIGVALWYPPMKAQAPSSPTGSTTPEVATSTNEAKPQASLPVKARFAVSTLDTISSWNFKGDAVGNETLTKQAQNDITYLKGLLGGGKYDDYDLYNGLANDYASLGDAKTAYDYYNRAIAIHPNKGLAFMNLGHLFDGMRAYHSAIDAYKDAVTVEPAQLQYHIQRLTFLSRQFPSDNALILGAFTDASKQFGDTAPVLTVEAQWLTDVKRYADAITAWEKVKSLMSGSDSAAIDAEIARLRAKQ
jgi:tetratricopeptide (TPR) repeat protein